MVDVEDTVTTVTTATGNAISGAVEGGSLTLTSDQDMQGDARAETTLTGSGAIGAPTTLLTEAVGNTGDAGAYGADMTATATQTLGAGSVTARTDIAAPTGQMLEGGTVGATALGNSWGFGASDGSTATVAVTQTADALVQADVEAVVQYVPDGAVFNAAATVNNVSSSGTSGTTQTFVIDQSSTGPRVQGSTFVGAANAWEIQGGGAAIANNVAITNEDGALEVAVEQDNTSYVRGEAVVSAYDFGLASSVATGVGNSVVAGNAGEYVDIDNDQFNSGGVEVISSFEGNTGYDAYSSATAIGNAVTGYACSECQGTLIASSRQVNNADVSAASAVSVTGSGRAIVGTATAIGNTSSFYVTSPGG